MSGHRNGAERALSLIDAQGRETDEGLRRDEHSLRLLAEELASALEHMERALLASKGTGFSGRVREAFEAADLLQREAAREFGRKVGDRMGRANLWRVQRGVDLD